MLKDISPARLAGAWCAMVIVAGGFGVVAGAPITVGNANLLLVTCLAPAAVMLLVWRGAAPIAIPEVSSVNRSPKAGRP